MARLDLNGVGIAPGVGVGSALVLHTVDHGPIGKREIDEVPLVEAAPRYNAEDAKEAGKVESAFPGLADQRDAAE